MGNPQDKDPMELLKTLTRQRIRMTWQLAQMGGNLKPEDARLVKVMRQHPEYADLWERKELIYSVQATENASRVFAHGEALNFYQNARDCAISLNDAGLLIAIEEAIGDVYSDRGQHLLAVDNYERALSLASTRVKKAALQSKIGSSYTQIGDERYQEGLTSLV